MTECPKCGGPTTQECVRRCKQRIADGLRTADAQPEMSCFQCGRTETANARSPSFPDKPIPRGWQHAIHPVTLADAVSCERCRESAQTALEKMTAEVMKDGPLPTGLLASAASPNACEECNAVGGPDGVLLSQFLTANRWRCYDHSACLRRRCLPVAPTPSAVIETIRATPQAELDALTDLDEALSLVCPTCGEPGSGSRCGKHASMTWGKQTWSGTGWGMCIHCAKEKVAPAEESLPEDFRMKMPFKGDVDLPSSCKADELAYRAAMAITSDPSLDATIIGCFFEKVRAETIEACAKAVEAQDPIRRYGSDGSVNTEPNRMARACAAAIRILSFTPVEPKGGV